MTVLQDGLHIFISFRKYRYNIWHALLFTSYFMVFFQIEVTISFSSFFLWCAFLRINTATATNISTNPMAMCTVNGSPKTIMPIHIAVSGSKAPSIATKVLPILFSDKMRVMLLTTVGSKPNRKRLSRTVPVWMAGNLPEVNMAYNMSSSIVKKKI